MQRHRRLTFLVLTFSLLGVVAVIAAIIARYAGREPESGASASMVLLGVGVLMQGIAAIGSITSGILKEQANRIEALERRLREAESVAGDKIRS
jgi:hypothetical protein